MFDNSIKDFFISYHSKDIAWAESLSTLLEEQESTFLSQSVDSKPRDSFPKHVQKSFDVALQTIILFSSDYIDLCGTIRDLFSVFNPEQNKKFDSLILLRVGECPVEYLIPQCFYVDLVGLEKDQTSEILLKVIRFFKARLELIHQDFILSKQQASLIGLPSVWSIPFQHSQYFCGRETQLLKLKKKFSSKQRLLKVQILYGLSGVGKTRLATEYAYRYINDYSLVWWIDAESQESILFDLIQLTERLKLPTMGKVDQKTIIDSLQVFLSKQTGWLLIFDNADKNEVIQDFLNIQSDGHILITSRNPDWKDFSEPMLVPVLKNSDSKELLRKITEIENNDSSDELTKVLGNLPLILEQAGTFIKENRITYSQYLDLWLSQHHKFSSSKSSDITKQTIKMSTTWEITINQIKKFHPASIDFLNLCAFFSSHDIPYGLFVKGVQHLPENLSIIISDDMNFKGIIDSLYRYSLIDVRTDSISIHPFLQLMTKERLDDDNNRYWIEVAIDVMKENFIYNKNNVESWEWSSRLLPHVMILLNHADSLGIVTASLGDLLNHIGSFLIIRCEFQKAKVILNLALSIIEEVHGSDHPETANVICNLGRVYRNLAEFSKSKEFFERALEIDKAAHGLNHPNVGRDIDNLGIILWELNDLEGAQKHFEQSMEINKVVYGSNHPNIVKNYNNIGLIFFARGNNQEALSYYMKALEICQGIYHEKHPNLIALYTNIGIVSKNIGELIKSQSYLKHALEIAEEVYGYYHLKIAWSKVGLGLVLFQLGNYQKALFLIQQALSIHRTILNQQHPEIAADFTYIGDIMLKLGNVSAARGYYENALDIYRKFYTTDHINITTLTEKLDKCKFT
jgi:tetratricopeptide (TPR) repeat protein